MLCFQEKYFGRTTIHFPSTNTGNITDMMSIEDLQTDIARRKTENRDGFIEDEVIFTIGKNETRKSGRQRYIV